jgi:hypothetical protein
LVTDRRLVAGVLLVPLGFVGASPYSVLRFTTFAADFTYNYVTFPVYGGLESGTGYALFLMRIVEIVGWPVASAAITAAALSPLGLSRCSSVGRATTVAALGVLAVYFLKFGSAARVEVRLVLPVVPFLLLAGSSLLARINTALPRALVAGSAVVIAYSLIASLWVGRRFAMDPRMAAQSWLSSHAAPGSVIESSPYSPRWNLYPSLNVQDIRMPRLSGRGRLFAQVFADNPDMLEMVRRRSTDGGIGWYEARALASRRPDFIALDSLFYDRFFQPPFHALYPEVSTYLRDLLNGELGYDVVFEQSSHEPPMCLYPRRLDIVDNRIVILKRSEMTNSP